MQTFRALRTAVLLVGALCLLAVPAAIAGTTHTPKTHARKAHAHRLCKRTRTHGRVHKAVHKGTRHHASRASHSHPCAARKRSRGHRRHHRTAAHNGSRAHTPLTVSGSECRTRT